MKQDQTFHLQKPFRESAMPTIPGKDLLFSGIASLVLHALAILLVIAVGNLFSAPAKLDKSPGLNVSLVTFSASSPSRNQASEIQVKGSEAPPSGNKEEIIPKRTAPESQAMDRKALKRQIREKLRETLLLPAPSEIKERGAGKEGKITTLTDSDSKPGRTEMALYAPAAETAGKEQGKEGISSGHGNQRIGAQGESSKNSSFAVSRYQQTPPPAYPQAARQKGYEGLVLISVEILENGSPGQLLLKKSSGYEILDQAALSAVRKWKFFPAIKNSVRIRTWGNVPIRFVLQDAR